MARGWHVSFSPWKDPIDAYLFNKLIQKDHIYNFLTGLNKELDDIRSYLLDVQPLPSIEKIFAKVRYEDHRH